SSLGHAPVQRHLAAFESALELEAGARLRTLVPAARLRALPGALTAAHSLLRMLGALRRAQGVKTHKSCNSAILPCCNFTSLRPGDAPCESSRARPPCPSIRRCGGGDATRGRERPSAACR